MAAITFNLPDDLEETFRLLTREKYGDKQGKLSKGAVEAISAWCENEKHKNYKIISSGSQTKKK
jgi:hypothetical protein